MTCCILHFSPKHRCSYILFLTRSWMHTSTHAMSYTRTLPRALSFSNYLYISLTHTHAHTPLSLSYTHPHTLLWLSFQQYASWNKEMREPLYFNVVVDWHLYQFQFPQYRTYEHIAAARQWEQTIEEFDSIHPIIVGKPRDQKQIPELAS